MNCFGGFWGRLSNGVSPVSAALAISTYAVLRVLVELMSNPPHARRDPSFLWVCMHGAAEETSWLLLLFPSPLEPQPVLLTPSHTALLCSVI